MFTQHPTLLIGPSDWDETRAPKAEFDRRIAALWAAFPDASQAIVFGSAARHAELAYLTNFVPKLEPGIALLTRDGNHKLLFGGGPNMIGAMKPLTFIADMAPLNALAKLIAGWKSPLLIGGGAMTSAVRKTIDDATDDTAQDATAHVQSLMRRKSPSELACIRDACAILNKVAATMREAVRGGHGAATALLAGERAAIDAGAQDIRTLFSLDGGRTLRPFETHRRPPRRAAAGLCRGAQVQLLGGRLCLHLERAAAGSLARGPAARQCAVGDQSGVSFSQLAENPGGRERRTACTR